MACNMYDVIVIGAGPAGCTAAKILAENGYHVLMAEKCRLPRYKSCSGMIIRKTVELVQQYYGQSIPRSVMCAPIENKGMIFTNDRGEEYRFEQSGYNVWRSSFDHWLATIATACGAELRDGTTVVSCTEHEDFTEVTLRGKITYQLKSRYVLNCEGVVGGVKRKLLRNQKDYITTFQTFNKGSIQLDPHYFYAYLQPELSEYDAWFNVKDHLLVLGVAVKNINKISSFYNSFLSYMKAHHQLQIEQQIKAEKWLMPHIHPGCAVDYGTGRILFAGDIAGFLNPMGEGISAAIESGYWAATAISDHFDQVNKVCAAYQDSTKTLKQYMERQWHFVGSIAATFSHMKTL